VAERRFFGTDGVRGPAGTFLTAELAVRLGKAAALESGAERPQVLILRDTRESGPMLESGLAAGIASVGGDVFLGGVLPTAAASILTRHFNFDAAAMISASHNSYEDNGIKFFDSAGNKLDDEAEARIESRLDDTTGETIGRVRTLENALDDYLRQLRTAFPLDLSGAKVLLDCAHGATYRAAPAIFSELGAEVVAVATEPDGRNINDGVGSTHIDKLGPQMAESGADVGFAFDGDGDRMLAVDRSGRVHDGDDLIGLIAHHLKDEGKLGGGVAVTVMSNYGFHQAMGEAGIETATTAVGDRYVLEALRENDWSLGGEQAGHIIWSDFVPTGDGIGAALLTMQALAGRDLAETEAIAKLPQQLDAVKIADRDALDDAKGLWAAVEKESAGLEGRGRVLVRPSGTEPLVRIMVEAPTDEECGEILGRLMDVARAELT
jgi:phosphoglucosamine mutase